ncbi:MAG: hypothetical protein ABIP74_03270 [Candidatus Saccharimonas sp.]
MITERQTTLFERSYTTETTDQFRDLVLVDPFSGEPMHSRDVPPSIDRIPHLHEGLSYLREHADSTKLTLFASRHADDVVHDADELNPLLDAHDSYFLEGYGTMAKRREIYRRASSEQLTKDDWNNYRSAPGPYTDRQLEAIKGRDKPIFMPEIPQDGTDEEAAFLEYSLIMNEFWPLAFGDDPQMTLNLILAIAGSNVIREWYMLANIVSQMASHEQETGQMLNAPLIWMGGGHAQSLAAKVYTLGVKFETIESRYNQEHVLSDDAFAQTASDVAINGLLRLR